MGLYLRSSVGVTQVDHEEVELPQPALPNRTLKALYSLSYIDISTKPPAGALEGQATISSTLSTIVFGYPFS